MHRSLISRVKSRGPVDHESTFRSFFWGCGPKGYAHSKRRIVTLRVQFSGCCIVVVVLGRVMLVMIWLGNDIGMLYWVCDYLYSTCGWRCLFFLSISFFSLFWMGLRLSIRFSPVYVSTCDRCVICCWCFGQLVHGDRRDIWLIFRKDPEQFIISDKFSFTLILRLLFEFKFVRHHFSCISVIDFVSYYYISLLIW